MPNPRNLLHWNATCKVAPALCDIQAPDDTIRIFETFTVTVAGVNVRQLYTVPAGKSAIIQYASCYCINAPPDGILWHVREAAVNYIIWVEAHIAWQRHVIKPDVYLKSGNSFGVSWNNCGIGNVLEGTVIGYQIADY